MLKAILTDALEILTIIENHQHEAYLVGGCVRDYLLNKEINDIDITTSATPKQLKEMFTRVILVHEEHDTVVVIYKKKTYEITTFRHKGKEHEATLETDLNYRDFTMNALAMDKKGTIIDPFYGRNDIKNRQIKAVEDAHERYNEDPLRMLRAIRFASQFGFDIEHETFNAIMKNIRLIESVSIERITNEMRKLFQGDEVKKGIDYLIETKLTHYLPIFKDNPSLLQSMPKNISSFYSFSEVIALFHYLDINISIQTWIKSWKCSNQEKKEAMTLYSILKSYETEGFTSWLLYQLPSALDEAFVHLCNIIYPNALSVENVKMERKQLPIHSRTELAIDGKKVIEYVPNRKPGVWIEQILQNVEKKVVLKELVNDEQRIKEWIVCHRHEIN